MQRCIIKTHDSLGQAGSADTACLKQEAPMELAVRKKGFQKFLADISGNRCMQSIFESRQHLFSAFLGFSMEFLAISSSFDLTKSQ